MTEEESFVILGSSPLPSICSHGNSLLHDALDKEENESATNGETKGNEAAPLSLNQPSAISEQTKSNEGSLPATLPSGPNSLAASFILGEVTPDVLKNSVYSQFPSLCSMQACAEDVVKLQTMMTEYLALKQTLDKVNHTMQEYYKITQQWRKEAANREEKYQEQLQECQTQIDKLTEENRHLKKEVDSNLEQMRLVEDLRQKEHDELRQSVSEKSSLISNMRVEIDKLQQHQLLQQSFEYVSDNGDAVSDYIKRDEHERQVKDLKRQMSELLAENLDSKDMKKTYVDEINCLKVNLTSTEELLKAMRAEINELKAKDAQKADEITHLQTQIETYRRDFEMERADREKNAGEKEQYLLDLRALQRRNQELIEALADKSNQSIGTSSTSSSKSSVREEQRPVRVLDPTGAAAKTSDAVMRCPICSKPFSSLSVLQSHVNDCLDKN